MRRLPVEEEQRRLNAINAAIARGERHPFVHASKDLGDISSSSLAQWASQYKEKERILTYQAAAMTAVPAVGSPSQVPNQRELKDAEFWRRKYNAAEKTRLELEQLSEQLAGIRNLRADPVPWGPLVPSTQARSIIIAHTSDLHMGEVIDAKEVDGLNSYNPDVASARMERYFRTVCEVGKRWLHDAPCDGVLLTLGGDLISGSIHEELSQTNALTSPEQVAALIEVYQPGIEALADTFGAVHVAAVPGNHGRMTVKPTAKLASRMSYDIMAAAMLKDRMRDDKRITWSIASSFDVRVPVYGRTILVTHGDRIGTGGGQGFAGPVLPIIRGGHKVKLQSASAGLDCDLILMGHYHTSAAPPGILANGSVPGYSEYGNGLRGSVEPPKQWLARFSSTWGLCETLAVQLEESTRRWKAK